jgi:CRP/FNR family transcriptional regulator, cyclic AMP receptor protein
MVMHKHLACNRSPGKRGIMRKALYMLGILDDVDIDWVARNGVVRHINAGTVLIEEKKSIDSLYILLEGQLAVTVGVPNATHIATLFPGEIVGEISFVDSRPPAASVVAMQNSEVLALSSEMLRAKLAKDHEFAEHFYRSIATFLADRLWVTVGRFGYGSGQQDADIDEVHESFFDEISLAATRFDKLVRQLRGDYKVKTTTGYS